MTRYEIFNIKEKPELRKCLAQWFHEKWSIPSEAYLESMNNCLNSTHPIPQWYGVMNKSKIIAGIGVIENDFHNRKDLTPNLCALYVEEEYRCQGIAKQLLDVVCRDMKKQGIETVYLVTEHTSYYEKYGWKFLCMVQNEGEETLSRLYSF